MRLVVIVATLAFAATAFAQSPAPAPPPASAPPPGAPAGSPPSAGTATAQAEEPTVEERRLVAYVATGVTVASLASGITFGILAQTEFNCAKDVINCNKTLTNKIVGTELFDVRREIEQKALAADMSYLFALASAVVATAGYLAGFVFVDQTAMTEEAPPSTRLAAVPAPAATAAGPIGGAR
jgi:hypothetical protein